ncbi:hypothetical protein HNP48_005652 [Acidovorax soli]|uniref:Uncharacterized protein n=1 Tax=Acidovorax soli TaxID=592050 RepID=A0A7X0UCS9_9BURK|nr:hypothetical protein [Acidovorax soli]MBB6562935.1 hypothetical protein [Acidovorax soli]
MSSYIFVSPGSDPGAGLALVDPMLSSSKPSMGTCRPDLRRMVKPGDHIFVISGSRGRTIPQYVIGGMQIDKKLDDQLEALRRHPENALRFDGKQRTGNIIALPDGTQDPRDHHDKFESRIKNYILGKDPVMLETPKEVELGRDRSVGILSKILEVPGYRMQQVVGRSRKLSTMQVDRLLRALDDIKQEARS